MFRESFGHASPPRFFRLGRGSVVRIKKICVLPLKSISKLGANRLYFLVKFLLGKTRIMSWGFCVRFGQPLIQLLPHHCGSFWLRCCDIFLLANIGLQVIQLAALVLMIVNELPLPGSDDRRRLTTLVSIVRVMPEQVTLRDRVAFE